MRTWPSITISIRKKNKVGKYLVLGNYLTRSVRKKKKKKEEKQTRTHTLVKRLHMVLYWDSFLYQYLSMQL